MNAKGSLMAFMAVALLSLLIAAIIPDIEAQDDRVRWEPATLGTATATDTPTAGWYDELPTPSYATVTPTPDLTLTLTTTAEATKSTPIASATPTPTTGLSDVLVTLTAQSER